MSGAYNLRKRTNPVSYSEDAGSQLKLTDLAKVVVHPAGTSSVCFTPECVLEARAVLDNPLSTNKQVLQSLRQLSCLLVSKADLEQTLVAHAVRRHRKSSNEEVQRIASNLIEKWKQVVLAEKSAERPAEVLAERPAERLAERPVQKPAGLQQQRLQLRPVPKVVDNKPIVLT